MTVLSDDTVAAGLPLVTPQGLALDEARGRVLLVDPGRQQIVAIDLSTGDRSVLSN